MPGPAANPNKRYSRYARGRQVVELSPAGRTEPAPAMPAGRVWAQEERALWLELWASPQATQWLPSHASAVALYVTYACAVLSGVASAWQATEARHLGDKLGLTPAGMTALNWVLLDEDAEQDRTARSRTARTSYDHLKVPSARDRLRVVDPVYAALSDEGWPSNEGKGA